VAIAPAALPESAVDSTAQRRGKTQGSLPSEDAAVVLLFSLAGSGQIQLRRIAG